MTSGFSYVFVTLSIGFLSTVFLTYVLIKLGLRKSVLDIPNERSSHSSPVPRGGGLAIIVTFVVFLFVAFTAADLSIDASTLKALILGGVIIAVVGIVDDLGHVSYRWRLATHFFAALLALGLLPEFPKIIIFGATVDLGLFGYLFFGVSIVWYVNLFNFMDGIDGIAGIEAITVLLNGSLILFIQGQHSWLTLLVFLAVCTTGFLIWNWPPAKVFMGDACSSFLGFMLAVVALATSIESSINLWTWIILCGVFIVDATTTLIRRIVRRECWYEAHKNHAYQILARRLGSHKKVSFGVLLINVVWLLPLGLVAAIFPYWGLTVCCIALIPLLIVAIGVGAGTNHSGTRSAT